jgi:hypothetical protein
MAIEDFKKKHFMEDHPGAEFPAFENVGASQRANLKEEVALRLGLSRDTDALDVVKRVHECFGVPSTYDATEASFNLKSVVADLALEIDEYVYINWDRFDHLDRIRFTDLAEHFPYIWYSSSDDIEIYDDKLRWVIVIRHDGAAALVPMLHPGLLKP